jgi:hypothetical protein
MSLSVPEAIDMKITLALLLCLTVFLISCGDKPKASTSDSAPSHATGRAETRGLEAAGAVGYDGAAIRHEVDNALNKTDVQNAETRKAMDQINAK